MVIEDFIIVITFGIIIFGIILGVIGLYYFIDSQPKHYVVQVNEGIGMNENG